MTAMGRMPTLRPLSTYGETTSCVVRKPSSKQAAIKCQRNRIGSVFFMGIRHACWPFKIAESAGFTSKACQPSTPTPIKHNVAKREIKHKGDIWPLYA